MKQTALLILLLLAWRSALPQTARQKVDSLNELSFAFKDKDFERSRDYARQALQQAVSSGYLAGQSDSHVRLGLYARNKGQYAEALQHYHTALEIRQSLDLKDKVASVMDNIGVVQRQLGQSDSAAYYMLASLHIREAIGDQAEIAKSAINLGNLYNYLGDARRAVPYHISAFEHYNALQETEGIIKSCISLGNDYRNLGLIDSARYYLLEGISLAGKSSNLRQVADLHSTYGLVLLDASQFTEALAEFRECNAREALLGDRTEFGNSLLNIAEALLGMGQVDSAMGYLDQALALSRELQEGKLEQEALHVLSKAAERKGDTKAALDYFSAYADLKAKRLDLNTQVAEMEVRYDVEKKESLIRQLEDETRWRKMQRNFLLAGLAALVVFVLLQWRVMQQRKVIAARDIELHQQRVNELMQQSELKSLNATIQGQDEERKRIAQDLHDSLGSMLATIKMHFSMIEEKMKLEREETDAHFERTRTLIGLAVDEVRRISHNMVTSEVLRFGILKAVQELRDDINAKGSIEMEVVVDLNEDARLPLMVENAAYRIIQELVSNVLKHAKATELTVQMIQYDATLSLLVEDNGVGFSDDPNQLKQRSLGLKNVRSRAESLGGTVNIDSGKGNGTTIVVEIPIA